MSLNQPHGSRSFEFIYQDIRPLRNHGELDVLQHVFLASEVEAPIALAKARLAICVEEDICLPPPRPGAGGIERSHWPRSVTPCARLQLQLEFQLWSWPKVRIVFCSFSPAFKELDVCLLVAVHLFRPKIICRTITFALSFVLQKCGRPYGIGQEGEAQEALPMKEGSPL